MDHDNTLHVQMFYMLELCAKTKNINCPVNSGTDKPKQIKTIVVHCCLILYTICLGPSVAISGQFLVLLFLPD